MRKLRDETILRDVLWHSIYYPYTKVAFTDQSFEMALQDTICLNEHSIEELKKEIEYRKHCVSLLVRSHFEFMNNRRGFIRKLKERSQTLKRSKESYVMYRTHEVALLDEYLARPNEAIPAGTPRISKKGMTAYLKSVRKGCAERKPWLPQKVFDPALIEGARAHYQMEEL